MRRHPCLFDQSAEIAQTHCTHLTREERYQIFALKKAGHRQSEFACAVEAVYESGDNPRLTRGTHNLPGDADINRCSPGIFIALVTIIVLKNRLKLRAKRRARITAITSQIL